MAVFNGQSSGEENVINILVIKEPLDWQQTGTEPHLDNATNNAETGVQNSVGQSAVREGANSCNPLYKGQSFIIDSRQRLREGLIPISRTQPSVGSVAKNQEISIHQNLTQRTKQSALVDVYKVDQNNHNLTSSFLHDHHKVHNCSNTEAEGNNQDCHLAVHNSSKDEQNAQKVKFGSHDNISFPAENHLESSIVEKCFPKTSTSDVSSPQVFTSSMYYSPALVSQPRARTDPETPKVTMTPDSGFCTPSQSQSESASVNVFFTSTPRRSKSVGPKTSTPCLSETPKGSADVLHHKFSELYNSVDWDSLDDSCELSEDAKEDENGELSPNSSLRSVQWLKGFSIGDSVMKPLLSSPPTPCASKVQGVTTGPTQTGQVEKGLTSHTCSADRSDTAPRPCTDMTLRPHTSGDVKTSTVVTTVPARAMFPSSTLTPLPVIMAPTVPTFLQTKPVISSRPAVVAAAPVTQDIGSHSSGSHSHSSHSHSSGSHSHSSGSHSHSSGSHSHSSGSQSHSNGSHSHSIQRKALEELKMNKAERNIGRSKYVGKIFSRPGYSYMDLIKMSMQSSKEGEMTLKEIITWIEDHFPFFKHEAKDSWKSSIRHNLSLHSDFMKADDKKHGCKWKLCDGAKGQHTLYVPAPQEMTSVQSAYLRKAKRNAPQHILPKVNAYALVPIHNLANPVVDNPPPPQQHHLPLPPPLQRKPVHILPKQPDDMFALIQQQEEELHHHHLSHIPPSQQHQVIQHLLQKGPQSKTGAGIIREAFDASSDMAANNLGIYSSDSNSSMSFQSCNSSDVSYGQTGISCPFNVSELETHSQDSTGFSYLVENCSLKGSSEPEVSLSQSSCVPSNQNFPVTSVVEIQEREGANPREKKIVFVLQDAENEKQKHQRRQSMARQGSSDARLSGNEFLGKVCDKPATDLKTSCFGKKKWKEGSKSRHHRGPVLNLQSVLEDQKASDTIGRLLQEEDKGKGLDCDNSQEISSFTRVKICSRADIRHLNHHMQKAFQEQGFNSCQSNSELKRLGVAQENSFAERLHSEKHTTNSVSKLLPASSKKRVGSRERMTIIKSKNQSSDSFDSSINRTADSYSSNLSFKSGTAREDNSHSAMPSASQLVFRRLSSGDQSSLSTSFSSLSSSCSSPFSSEMVKVGSERDVGACRRVGNPSSRSKSRRKQVHVPRTTEVSPLRKSFSGTKHIQWATTVGQDQNSSFTRESPKMQIETEIFPIKPDRSMSLLTEIQQPSLDVLQHKPLELSLPLTPVKQNFLLNYSPQILDGFQPNVQVQSMDSDKDIENIFCSGSPVKDTRSGKCLVSEHALDMNMFSPVFETPPKLHFLSTFSTREAGVSLASANKISSCDDKFYNDRGNRISELSDHSSKREHHYRNPVDNFLEGESDPYSCADGGGSGNGVLNTSLKRVCRGENRGYGFLDLSMSLSDESSLTNRSSTFLTSNNLTSMDTPPCGTSLHPSSPSRPVGTSRLDITAANISAASNNTSTDGKPTLVSPPHQRQHHYQPLPLPSITEQACFLSSLTPSVPPADLSTLDVPSPLTPPCSSTPLFMSTPNHHLYPSSATPMPDLLPFPDNLSGMLDAGVLENLDSYLSSLPGHPDGLGLGTIFPNLHHSPCS